MFMLDVRSIHHVRIKVLPPKWRIYPLRHHASNHPRQLAVALSPPLFPWTLRRRDIPRALVCHQSALATLLGYQLQAFGHGHHTGTSRGYIHP